MNPKAFLAAAAIATLAFTGVALAADAMISQDEMQAAFKGKSFKDDDGAGNIGVISYGDDMSIKYEGKTGPQAGGDSGTYKFDKGGYCSSWKKLRNGAEKCFTASKLDNGYQLWTLDGKKDDTLTSQ
jgi:hypothetical protein